VKIAGFDIVDCIMRKEDPKWAFALQASPITEGIVLTLTADDGTKG